MDSGTFHMHHRRYKPLPALAICWLVSILLLLCALPGQAEPASRIALLLSAETSFYEAAADQLKQTLKNANNPPATDTLIVGNAATDRLNNNHYRLIVAVGTSAAKAAANHAHNTPVLNIFIPKSGYERIASTLPAEQRGQFSAIYLDQPLERMISLGKLLQPDARHMGTILGPVSSNHLDELIVAAEHSGLNLHAKTLTDGDNPITALKPIVTSSDFFVAIPDQAILNRSVAKWILYLSYSEKVPVIGFSQAYTNAGALASVFSSPTDIGTHAGELITRWLNDADPDIWRPQYTTYCTVSTNPAVARSLGIILPSEKKLTSLLKERENR